MRLLFKHNKSVLSLLLVCDFGTYLLTGSGFQTGMTFFSSSSELDSES